MKTYLYALCLFAVGSALAQNPSAKNDPPSRQQAGLTVLNLPVRQELLPGYDQRQVPERNPAFDVYLLSQEKDLSLQLAIVNNVTGVVVHKPVASDWIVVSPQANVIAVAGKKGNPGYLTKDGHTEYDGIELWNMQGDVLFSDPNTGVISQFFLDEEGALLLSCRRDLGMYAANGAVKWKRPAERATIDLAAGGDYFTIDRYSLATAMHTLELADAATGLAAHTFTYYTSDNLDMIYAARENREVAYSKFDGSRESRKWTLEVFDLSTGKVKYRSSDLEGRPCFMQYRPDDRAYEMILWLPVKGDRPNTFTLQHAVWQPDLQKMRTEPLGSFGIDPATSGFYREAGKNGYTLKLDNQVLTIQ